MQADRLCGVLWQLRVGVFFRVLSIIPNNLFIHFSQEF